MRIRVFGSAAGPIKSWRRWLRVKLLERRDRREDAAVLCARIAPGMFAQDELRLLYRTAAEAPGPGDLAEIGSWKGRTSIIMARGLQDASVEDARIWAIDHFVGSEEHRDRMIAEGGSTLAAFRHNIRFTGVDELINELAMKSVDAAKRLHERGVKLRMLFIDGAHDEDSVRQDIASFLPLMKTGGIIALHDCAPESGFIGVWKAYQAVLQPRVDEIDRASSLLVTHLRSS